jgi:hypothetical protein
MDTIDNWLPDHLVKCKKLRIGYGGRAVGCRSLSCPNPYCQKKYAEKEAAILKLSFEIKPPDFNLTLKYDPPWRVCAKELSAIIKDFTQKIRDYRKKTKTTIEYYLNIEFVLKKPHIHLTLIAPSLNNDKLVKSIIKAIWSKCCSNYSQADTSVYCKKVKNPIGLANYITKNLKNSYKYEKAPCDWDFKACRLVWKSRSFLIKNKATLWKEQIQQWYPGSKEENIEDLNKIHQQIPSKKYHKKNILIKNFCNYKKTVNNYLLNLANIKFLKTINLNNSYFKINIFFNFINLYLIQNLNRMIRGP